MYIHESIPPNTLGLTHIEWRNWLLRGFVARQRVSLTVSKFKIYLSRLRFSPLAVIRAKILSDPHSLKCKNALLSSYPIGISPLLPKPGYPWALRHHLTAYTSAETIRWKFHQPRSHLSKLTRSWSLKVHQLIFTESHKKGDSFYSKDHNYLRGKPQ